MSDPLKNATRDCLRIIMDLKEERDKAKLVSEKRLRRIDKLERQVKDLEMEMEKQDRRHELQMDNARLYIQELRRNDTKHRGAKSSSTSSSTQQGSANDNPGPSTALDFRVEPGTKRRKKDSQTISSHSNSRKDIYMDQKIKEGVVRFQLKKPPATNFFKNKHFKDWFQWIQKESHHMKEVVFQNDYIILVKCTRSKVIHFTDTEEFPQNSDSALNLPVLNNGWTMDNTKCYMASPTSSHFKECVTASPFDAEECLGRENFKMKCPTPGKVLPYFFIKLFVREE